jgi:hypothetical protein
MSRSYTSSPYSSIGVLWDCFTFYIRLGIPCEFFPSGILTKIAFTSALHVTCPAYIPLLVITQTMLGGEYEL